MKIVASQIAYTVPVTSVESTKTFSAAVLLARVYTRDAQIFEKSKNQLKNSGPQVWHEACSLLRTHKYAPRYKMQAPGICSPRYRTTTSSVWRQIPFVHCSPPEIKQKCGKYIRNLTSPSQLRILFLVFLFALVFVITRYRSWPSDFSPILFTFTDTFCTDQRGVELSFDEHKIT